MPHSADPLVQILLPTGRVGRARPRGRPLPAPTLRRAVWTLLALCGWLLPAGAAVFEERDGLLTIEAEDFARQTNDEKRRWYRIADGSPAPVSPDSDPGHEATASGRAYMEILPDTRVHDGNALIHGENFSDIPGLVVLEFDVWINNPGRYWVWVRCHATGSEDNGVHVGLDGQWPNSGRRMQWCGSAGRWYWESKQRTAAEHCGVPRQIFLDIETIGYHTVAFSMREDGFEMDRFLLTRNEWWSMTRTVVGPAASPVYEGIPHPAPWWNNLAYTSDQWRVHTALGNLEVSQYPWLRHADLGWVWDRSEGLDSLFWWHPVWQWTWTSEAAMPFLYRFADGGWYYLPVAERDLTRLYNLSTGQWVSLMPE